MDCLAQDFRNRHILDMLQRYSRRDSVMNMIARWYACK
jgi:hypothetical protein